MNGNRKRLPVPMIALALLIPSVLNLAGIGCKAKETVITLPVAMDGGWKRGEVRAIAADRIPDPLRRLGALSGDRAGYIRDDVTVSIAVYRMPGATSAFEALQTYPKAADEYYFHKGASFVVIDVRELNPAERRPFLLGFQTAAIPGEDPGSGN